MGQCLVAQGEKRGNLMYVHSSSYGPLTCYIIFHKYMFWRVKASSPKNTHTPPSEKRTQQLKNPKQNKKRDWGITLWRRFHHTHCTFIPFVSFHFLQYECVIMFYVRNNSSSNFPKILLTWRYKAGEWQMNSFAGCGAEWLCWGEKLVQTRSYRTGEFKQNTT